ncbi:MAG: hypothetical protein QOF48_1496 [Verrucomicrobiota bacterium]
MSPAECPLFGVHPLGCFFLKPQGSADPPFATSRPRFSRTVPMSQPTRFQARNSWPIFFPRIFPATSKLAVRINIPITPRAHATLGAPGSMRPIS